MKKKNIKPDNIKAKEIKNYFDPFFTNHPVPMWIYDLENLRFLDVNNAAIQKYGYSREEFLKMTIKDIRPEEDIPLLLENIKKPRNEYQESGPWRHKLKNGEIIFVEITSHTINYNGRNAVLVHANDITKRLVAETELKKSEERYRFLTELVSDYAYAFKILPDGQLKGEWVTSNFNKVFGVTIQEIDEAGGWTKMVYPEDLPSAIAHATRVVEGHRDICEMRWLTKSGEIRWLRDYAIPVFDEENKKIVRIYGASQDITNQKLAEEKIKNLNSLLLAIRNINQLIVTEKDRNLLITKASKLLKETRGFHSVWMFILDNNQNISISTAYGLEEEYKLFLKILREGEFSRQVNEILTGNQPHDIFNLRELYFPKLPNYYQSSIFKIQYSERIYGFIIIFLERKIINEEEISLIQEVSNDIGLALYLISEEENKRLIEQSLVDREKKYRDVVENATELIYTTDINGYFTYVNPAGLKKTGYTLDELKKFKYLDLTLPEYRERIKRHYFRQYLNRIPNTNIEFPFYAKDGRIMWFEQNASLIIENDEVKGFQLIARDITEKKIFEKKLIESEELFRNLVENISDVFYITDANGKMKYCSPNLYTETGYSPQEILGRSYVRLIAPEDKRKVVDYYVQQAEIGTTDVQMEFRVLKKDYTRLWVDQRTRIVRDPSGKIIEYRNVIRNITEQKKLQEQISLERAYFKQLFESSPTAIVITDLDEKVLNANPAFIKTFGFEMEEIYNKSLLELIIPEEYNFESAEIFENIKAGKIVNKQVIRKTKFNLLKNFLLSAAPIIMNDRIIAAYAMYTDITDQISAQEAIKASEEHLRNILDTVQDAIFTVSITGILTSINPAFTKLTGWKIEEWLGKSLNDLIHSDDLPTAINLFINSIDGKATPLCELRIKKSDGSYLISEFQIAPQIKNGKIIGVLGIARDITTRKKLEENIRQTQKLESLGTLAAGIAHDFNNILSIMIGHASLLETMIPNNTIIKKNVDAITKAGMRAADLVKQILTFARKSDIKKEPLNINSILKEISKMLIETLPKTITINLKLEENLLLVPADVTQLHQVMINICVNARDAMPKGGTLSIETKNIDGTNLLATFPQAKNQPYVLIKISDTGIGIPGENLEHIFEPFFTTKERGQGTGMGLAVARGIIENHDGIITVESKLNEGTTFYIYLPGLIEAQPVGIKETDETIAGGNETILLVEDEELLLSLVESYLIEKGYNVIPATNSEEAFTIYKNYGNSIDLVLSDYGLPKFDGFELFKKLKDIDPEVKMIIASGFMDPKTKTEILKMGVKEFIQKPYHRNQILKTVRTILDYKKFF